jgi:hypothetical protein
MATFPELEPNTRSYDFGLFPLTEEPSLSAGIVRFRHSTSPQNYQLTLGYKAITDAQATLIRNHYQGQGGGYRSFPLPPIIWKGHTFSGNIVPSTTLWRYSDTPEEEHLAVGRINVTVTFTSDGTINSEVQNITVTVALLAGIADGDREYGLITQAVDESLDYDLVTAAVTATEDWGTIT